MLVERVGSSPVLGFFFSFHYFSAFDIFWGVLRFLFNFGTVKIMSFICHSGWSQVGPKQEKDCEPFV